MIYLFRCLKVLLITCLGASMAYAQGSDVQRDDRALEVLKNMTAYTSQLDQLVIRSTSFTDARLGAGLMIANSSEGEMVIDRVRSSVHISSFDGLDKKEIYFHDGLVTVFSSEKMFYGQAEIPKEIEAAADFALEELDIEAPLMDLIYRDLTSHVMDSQDTIRYLTDKSRIDGVDCHHIVIRGPEVDLQVWVEEGDKPLIRQVVITSKWEGGAPRFMSTMRWDTAPTIDPNIFIFKVPDGATNIGFVKDTAKP
jgi:hypothetical protein